MNTNNDSCGGSMKYVRDHAGRMVAKFNVVERSVYQRGSSKTVETFTDEQTAWNRVRRLTVEKGGGGWYYTVEKV